MAILSDTLDNAGQNTTPSWVAALDRSSNFLEMPITGRAQSSSTEEPKSIEKDAVAIAFEEGERVGRAAAEEEVSIEENAREALRSSFEMLDKSTRSALAQYLAETVAELCEQLIGEHLVNSSALSTRCSKIAESIGDSAAECVLHIHPSDAPLLDPNWAERWTIKPDASLNRGTLQLESADGLLCDGPDEWRRAIAIALES